MPGKAKAAVSDSPAPETTGKGEKKVSWVELYFDLVIVFAVTQVAAKLHHDISWSGVLKALILFIPIYWAWVGTSIHSNMNDVDTPVERLAIFTIALGGMLMALAVPEALHDRGTLYAASYLGIRIVLAMLLPAQRRFAPGPYSTALLVTAPMLLIGSFLHGDARLWVWGLAGLLDLSSPRIFRKRLIALKVDPAHLPERYGLFVIIALGESIVAVGLEAASYEHLSDEAILALAASFIVTSGLWWTYFAFGASAIDHAIHIAQTRVDMIRLVLTYAHVSFIGSIIAVAVGLTDAVAHPGEHLHMGPVALLYGGTGLFLATFGYTRYTMFKQHSWTRLPAAAVCFALLPLGTHVPTEWAVAILAVVVIALNSVEHIRVKKAGSL